MASKNLVSPKRPIRQLSVKEKLDAIQRVHNGESKASVARDIGVPESTLRGWCKSEDKLRNVARSCGTPESQHSVEEAENKDVSGDGGPSDRKRVRSDATPAPAEVETNLWYLLKQQHHNTGLPVNMGPTDLDKNGVVDGSWFWRWYKRYGYSQYPDTLQQVDGAKVNSETNGHPLPLVANNNINSVRSTLDSVLQNVKDNNNQKADESDDDDEDEDEPPATAAEAVGHGEKFLRWLECCSDPSVTAMQILQFRYLLNNVRACADRKAKQIKTKTRSRRK